ncbi:conserved hypothetical protein [Parvibaculum lavamentivorans DS-1]|uniref:Uncharacterized protein n=1 Tax=Parvibaculum lavamentivorans (strain DS-1 / DSM 13023 / NCIMB 13966) TaxID=402881 RepID=A7HXM2_PARL1|nr:protein phosphatase 2C domain-containing protein [Parvibaculum lavamentivorans]ABS64655.1 conserved hypothetical protein [Parvibaculum lavamentivorans DS-1]
MLRIVETLSDPGNPDKANEDAFGHAGAHAWVIDGATDVADGPLIGSETGAHWLAREASALFAAHAARYGADLHGLVRFTIETLALRFEQERLRPPNGRHEWPSAAMALLHAGEGKLACANFADCGLILLDDDSGEARVFGVQHTSREARAVSRTAELIAALASGEKPFDNEAIMAYLRESRRRQNTEEGYWILGIDPKAVSHMRHWDIPLSRPVTGLLFSDGFGSIVFDYHRMDPAALVRRAALGGLRSIADEVRRIEAMEDPDCLEHPRFKRHDDATAVLFRVE